MCKILYSTNRAFQHCISQLLMTNKQSKISLPYKNKHLFLMNIYFLCLQITGNDCGNLTCTHFMHLQVGWGSANLR